MKHSKAKKTNNTKEILFSIGGVVLLILVVIATSYAVFQFSKAGTVENTVRSGTLSFAYNESTNGISITNAQPMTDSAGKVTLVNDTENGVTQGYFDFNVSGVVGGATTLFYEIYGIVTVGADIQDYVKVYLTDGSSPETALAGYDGASVPTFGSLPTASSNALGKRLYLGSMTKDNTSQTFRLRLWIADTYTNAAEAKTFTMKVNVTADSSLSA